MRFGHFAANNSLSSSSSNNCSGTNDSSGNSKQKHLRSFNFLTKGATYYCIVFAYCLGHKRPTSNSIFYQKSVHRTTVTPSARARLSVCVSMAGRRQKKTKFENAMEIHQKKEEEDEEKTHAEESLFPHTHTQPQNAASILQSKILSSVEAAAATTVTSRIHRKIIVFSCFVTHLCRYYLLTCNLSLQR